MQPVNNLFADLSSNNAQFNAIEYRNAGHRIVAIKATEGTTYISPNHRGWCLRAGMEHLAVVHYHFARPDLGTDPHAEAEHFLSVALRLAGGRDYLVLDLERALPQGWQHDPAWSAAFDDYVQKHSRFHTILYANRSTLQQSDKFLVGDLRRVWDADWSTEPDYAPPSYTVAFRQTSDGQFGPEPHSIAGVGVCDVNRCHHTILKRVMSEQP